MGDIVPAPWGGHVVTSFGLCEHILRSRDWLVPDARWRQQQGAATRWTAASSREMAQTLPSLNPPEHTHVRKATAAMFDRRSLRALQHVVEKSTETLTGRLSERLHSREADLHTAVSEELPVTVIGKWLGLPPADYARLRELTHEQVFAQELLPSASQLARSDAATEQLRDYFTTLIRQRRARPGSDPVSACLRAWDALEPDREAADKAVHRVVFFVLLAALETTATLLTHSVLHLLQHPRQWHWLRAHPDQVPAAVEESLRFDPPTHVISRIAGPGAAIDGVGVEAGSMVHLLVGAANRDPAQHLEPDTFDVTRRATHLSFSAGMHYCLGASLARQEAVTLVTALLDRFPRLRLARAPEWAPRVAFRRPLTLYVTDSR
ncbi:cytochrome P450 [Streptomyces armeniacus]|nr:cytochrome P450 [Streptomyces armeniacus]